VRAALNTVVHLPLSVLEGEGVSLSEEYRVGTYYPVFILANSDGEVITRWTGYTGADRFLQSFQQAKTNLTTIKTRAGRFDESPTVRNGLALAQYYSDTREYLKARDYYRQLQSLQGSQADYAFEIFKATAEAVWNDLLPFDSVVAAADVVLGRPKQISDQLGQLAQIIANVARRTGDVGRIEKYLEAGARATSARTDKAGVSMNRDIVADYALYVLHDTTKALNIKKSGLGSGWDQDPARYFQYGEFCYQRRIDLAQAENYVRLATQKASEGKFKAKHLRLLAEILFARGKVDEAIATGEQALEQDPTTEYFVEKLQEWRQL
jgi:tetratricopeptide (TPR) repeat protein